MAGHDTPIDHEGAIPATSSQGETGRGGGGEEGLGLALLRQKWIIVLTLAASVTAGLVYLRGVPQAYTASARVYVQRTGPRIMTENQATLSQANNYVYTQAEILRSTPILAKALEQAGVREFAGLTGESDPVAALKGQLSVGVGRTDDIISVSLAAGDREAAARVVNAVVDAYVASQTEQNRSTASEIRKVLQVEKTKQDELLSSRLTALAAFRKANGILSLENSQGNVVLQRLSQFSDSLTAAQLAAIQAKAAYSAAAAVLGRAGDGKDGANGRVLAGLLLAQGHDLARRDQTLEEAEQHLAALRKEFTEEHPAVKAAAAAVEQLRAQQGADASQTAEGYLAALDQQARSAEGREAAIRAIYDEQLKESLELNSKSAEYALLQSDLKRTEQLCEMLDNRIKELAVTGEVGALNVAVLEPARAASAAPTPSWPKILGLAGLIGLVAGTGLALARVGLDSHIHSAESARDALDLPILGSVPHCVWGRDNLGALVEGDPGSALAESFRKIRTALCYGTQGAGRIVLVTSPRVGEGKTMVAGNLAVALACAGRKVLLIDGDLRCPGVHGRFGLGNDAGLSSVLRGECEAASVIRPGTVMGLDVMPSGPIAESPSELLAGMGGLLERLSERYEHIVINSPPVGPVTDAAVVATAADRVVLVLRAGISDREHTRAGMEALRQVGGRLAGVVFNGVRNAGGYYGYSRGASRRARRAAAKATDRRRAAKAGSAGGRSGNGGRA